MAQTKEEFIETARDGVRRVAECVPGWPLEWVSAKGRYGGKVPSLVLVHCSLTCTEHDPTQKTLLLTAKDRRRRSWSTALTLSDEPLLEAVETAMSRKLNWKLADIGEAAVDVRTASKKKAPRRLGSVTVLSSVRRSAAP